MDSTISKQTLQKCLLFIICTVFLLGGCGKKETGSEEMIEEIKAESIPPTHEPQVIVISNTEAAVIQRVEETETEKPDYSSLVTGVRYATDSVRYRTSPTTEGDPAGTLQPGTEVAYAGDENEEWIRIIIDDELYYSASRYFTDDPDWKSKITTANNYKNGDAVSLDPSWRFADFSAIHSGSAVMYTATHDRKNIVVGVNAGHGTQGGGNVKTWCHPDKTPKVTGGTTAAGAEKAIAVSGGMTFSDGTAEAKVNLRVAQYLRDVLLEKGYDVLMIRDGDDVQLDNVARTVICNQVADCHIAIHFDGDGLSYDKGSFYMSVPGGIKYMDPVASVWEENDRLGECLVAGLRDQGVKIFDAGSMQMDLTQTSFSSVPSVDIELGNQSSDHSDGELMKRAYGLAEGVDRFFGQ